MFHSVQATSLFQLLVCVLVALLAVPAPAQEQETPTEAPKLQIAILDGEGAINNIRQRTARDPIVEIRDENNKPVAGAVVVFTLPERGPSGVFANGNRMVTVTTDAQGQAAGTGLQPNGVEGQFQIQVSASFQGQVTSLTIAQTNAAAAAAGISAGTLGMILAFVGAAAVGGVIAIGGDDGGGGTQTPITTIAPGTPSVGAPR